MDKDSDQTGIELHHTSSFKFIFIKVVFRFYEQLFSILKKGSKIHNLPKVEFCQSFVAAKNENDREALREKNEATCISYLVHPMLKLEVINFCGVEKVNRKVCFIQTFYITNYHLIKSKQSKGIGYTGDCTTTCT